MLLCFAKITSNMGLFGCWGLEKYLKSKPLQSKKSQAEKKKIAIVPLGFNAGKM